jgi:hypothetical protein
MHHTIPIYHHYPYIPSLSLYTVTIPIYHHYPYIPSHERVRIQNLVSIYEEWGSFARKKRNRNRMTVHDVLLSLRIIPSHKSFLMFISCSQCINKTPPFNKPLIKTLKHVYTYTCTCTCRSMYLYMYIYIDDLEMFMYHASSIKIMNKPMNDENKILESPWSFIPRTIII